MFYDPRVPVRYKYVSIEYTYTLQLFFLALATALMKKVLN